MPKLCNRTTKVHADAMKIVEFLFVHGGSVPHPQDEIAYKIDMVVKQHGVYAPNMRRFSKARQHIMECVDAEGKACCEYRINYRKAGSAGSELALVDPSGDLGSHARAALSSLLGWMSRERQHQTENRRQIAEFEALQNHALANNDREGYRLLQTAVIDLDRDGTVLPETMAQLQVWASAISL